MIIIFTGPPLAGKGTQANLLSQKLQIPVFSIGAIIREEYQKGNPEAIEGYEQYSLKGLHLPVELKFKWLSTRMETCKDGFIIDNFPGTSEDLRTFIDYLSKKERTVDVAFLMNLSKEEAQKRMGLRSRADDKPEIAQKRRIIQDEDRIPVINYFKEQGKLIEINADDSIENIHKDILKHLHLL